MHMSEAQRIAVVGGAGHVGLPLSLLLADRGFRVTAVDADAGKVAQVAAGEMPFAEDGAQPLLTRWLGQRFWVTTEAARVADAELVIVTVGTPLDEHLNPDLGPVYRCLEQLRPFLSPRQVLILRSTLFPGTTQKLHELLRSDGLAMGVSYCPERIAQGRAIAELPRIPQIVSATDERTLEIVKAVFLRVTPLVVELDLMEAEVAKLFSNAWRYIKFAVANQFYTMAVERGLDFYRIRDAMMRDYDRAKDFPAAGFAAGPCLLKDTMQLAAFNRQHFGLGHAALLINETLPEFLVACAKAQGPLLGRRVGILGMAFKPDNDDARDSLAYKLKKLLQYEGAQVLCTDPFVKDPACVPLETVLGAAELLIIGCAHTAYRQLELDAYRVIDCWGLTRQGRRADAAAAVLLAAERTDASA